MTRGRGGLRAVVPLAVLGLAQGVSALPAMAQMPVRVEADRGVEQRRRDEMDMLERARAELAARENALPVDSAGDATDDGESVRRLAIEVEVAKRLQEAERASELDALSASIRRASSARGYAPPAVPPVEISAPPLAPGPPAFGTYPTTVTGDVERATVLLVMAPGRGGMRIFNPTADPILCAADVCWVSRGPDQDARMVPRRKALGPLNTLGGRAGACNDSVGCVFRNVEIGAASVVVQPIDLRLMRHDRREPREARIDRSCRAERGALVCGDVQTGPDYQMWVVPEPVALEAGGRALASAVGTRMRASASLR